jgi:hypothetical protein
MNLANAYALAAVLERRQDSPLGMAGVMMSNEVAAGRRLVQPGATTPFAFPADDWAFPQVVALDGAEVRIVAILARTPGRGAFRRLIDAICAAGFQPVVIEPIGVTMPAILARWGWRCTVRGEGFDRIEEWRPTAAR